MEHNIIYPPIEEKWIGFEDDQISEVTESLERKDED